MIRVVVGVVGVPVGDPTDVYTWSYQESVSIPIPDVPTYSISTFQAGTPVSTVQYRQSCDGPAS